MKFHSLRLDAACDAGRLFFLTQLYSEIDYNFLLNVEQNIIQNAEREASTVGMIAGQGADSWMIPDRLPLYTQHITIRSENGET
jgi:hypothetical protein